MQNICCKSKANNCHLLCGQQKRRDERVESGSHQSSGTKSGVSSSEEWAKENDKCLWNKSNNTDAKLSVAKLSWILFFPSLIWFSYFKAAVLLSSTHWGKHWKWRFAAAALVSLLSKQTLAGFCLYQNKVCPLSFPSGWQHTAAAVVEKTTSQAKRTFPLSNKKNSNSSV